MVENGVFLTSLVPEDVLRSRKTRVQSFGKLEDEDLIWIQHLHVVSFSDMAIPDIPVDYEAIVRQSAPNCKSDKSVWISAFQSKSGRRFAAAFFWWILAEYFVTERRLIAVKLSKSFEEGKIALLDALAYAFHKLFFVETSAKTRDSLFTIFSSSIVDFIHGCFLKAFPSSPKCQFDNELGEFIGFHVNQWTAQSGKGASRGQVLLLMGADRKGYERSTQQSFKLKLEQRKELIKFSHSALIFRHLVKNGALDSNRTSPFAFRMSQLVPSKERNYNHASIWKSATKKQKNLMKRHNQEKKDFASDMRNLSADAKAAQAEIERRHALAKSKDVTKLSNFLASLWQIDNRNKKENS